MENNIYEQLAYIQAHLNAPKSQKNTFGNYNYRSAEDILEALKPHLKETNTNLTICDDIIFIEGRFYVKATATLRNPKGEEVSASAFAREEESKKGYDSAQLTGATSSYARKYSLNGLFAIDDNKDFDATNTGDDKPDKKKGSKKAAEPAPDPYDDPMLQDAIEAARSAKSQAELTQVWKDWKGKYEHEPSFIQAIKNNPNHPSHKNN